MPLIPFGVLGDMRRIENDTMDWQATIARSGLVTPCSIAFDTRPIHIEGLPSFIHIPRWKVTMRDGTDLRAGDVLAVQKPNGTLWATVGSYTVIEITNPTTISVSASGFCLQTADASGAVTFFDSSDTVTFRDPATGQKVTSDVYIYEASRDAVLTPYAADYQWAVVFPSNLTYPNGHHIMIDHAIQWSELTTTNHEATLHRPRKPFKPVPLTVAYFLEMGASSLI